MKTHQFALLLAVALLIAVGVWFPSVKGHMSNPYNTEVPRLQPLPSAVAKIAAHHAPTELEKVKAQIAESNARIDRESKAALDAKLKALDEESARKSAARQAKYDAEMKALGFNPNGAAIKQP